MSSFFAHMTLQTRFWPTYFRSEGERSMSLAAAYIVNEAFSPQNHCLSASKSEGPLSDIIQQLQSYG